LKILRFTLGGIQNRSHEFREFARILNFFAKIRAIRGKEKIL